MSVSVSSEKLVVCFPVLNMPIIVTAYALWIDTVMFTIATMMKGVISAPSQVTFSPRCSGTHYTTYSLVFSRNLPDSPRAEPPNTQTPTQPERGDSHTGK